jgi:hypothetical protein
MGAQDRMMSMIREDLASQIQTHLQAQLALLLSQFQREPNIPTGTSSSIPPVHSVSHFRQSPVPDPNEPTPVDHDFIHREGRFHFPKSDCPGFNGTNPIEWLRKCTSFYELH